MKKPKVLVTGGAGFIGSHLVKRLLGEGYCVVVLDNLIRNVNHVKGLGVEFIKGDIRNKDLVIKYAEGCDYIFNLAAICLNRCKAYPQEAIEVNLQGSYNVFGAAIHHGIKVIHSSTSSVYGEPSYTPMDELHPANTIEPYGVSKLCADKFLEFLHKKHGLEYVALRYFNVYGTYQSVDAYYTSVINVFIKRVLAGQSPVINGSGDQAMDFTHVSDVVEANIAAINGQGIYNVGFGGQTTLKELAELILRYVGVDLEVEFLPREVLVTRRQCNNSKIKRELGVEIKTNICTGIKELIEHVKLNPEIY